MIPITSIMTPDVISVKKDTHINKALKLLIDNRISGLPVVDDDNKVVGILTEKDLLGCALTCNISDHDIVEKYMTNEVKTFDETSNALDICQFLIDNPIRRVPITKDGKLIGVVSRRDIMILILDACSKMSDKRYY